MSKLTFYKKTLAFCKIPWYYLTCVSGCGSAWLERRLREAEVASSNPATPIHLKASKSFTRFWRLLFCILFAALENCRKNLKNLKNGLLFIKFYAMIVFVPGCGSAWLERRLREAEVASSNPATPIHLKASKSFTRFWRLLFCILFAALENCRKNLKNLKNGLLFIKFYAMIVFVPGCGSAWLERRLREAEVASSNPATPIH